MNAKKRGKAKGRRCRTTETRCGRGVIDEIKINQAEIMCVCENLAGFLLCYSLDMGFRGLSV